MNFEEKYVDGWLLLTKTQVMLAQSVKGAHVYEAV